MEGANPAAAIAPTRDPTAPIAEVQLDENGNPIEAEPIPSNIPEEMLESMTKIWAVFDFEGKDSVTIDELRTIMRALDINVDSDDKLDAIK